MMLLIPLLGVVLAIVGLLLYNAWLDSERQYHNERLKCSAHPPQRVPTHTRTGRWS